MNNEIHHLDKPHQSLQLAHDSDDNQSYQGCVAIHEDSLYRPPTTHLAFCMGMAYNRLARPGEEGQMGRNHAADARVLLQPYQIHFLEYLDSDQTNYNQRTLF
jgi:hypothetical protein